MRSQFLKFKKTANKITTKSLIIYWQADSSPRFALVIPKKAVKQAAARNRLKRILKTTLLSGLKNSKVSAIIILKPMPIKDYASAKEKLTSELSQACKKIKAL